MWYDINNFDIVGKVVIGYDTDEYSGKDKLSSINWVSNPLKTETPEFKATVEQIQQYYTDKYGAPEIRDFKDDDQEFIICAWLDPVKGNDVTLIYGKDETGYVMSLGKSMAIKKLQELGQKIKDSDLDLDTIASDLDMQ